MKVDPAQSGAAQVDVGSVVALWRYPVKSMMGEELNTSDVTDRGLLGDRQFAVVDASTGKVAGAKNPRKWRNFFDYRAAYVEPPARGSKLPAVRLTLPDGSVVTTDQPDLAQILSSALGRDVVLAQAEGDEVTPARAEEYWPDMEGLEHRDTVTQWELPAKTFFDLAVVHLLTTATIDRLRALYPEGRFEVRRFRPNIVVATPDQTGFVENDWIDRTIAIGDEVRLRISGPCPRCVMTTLPQGDLPSDAGILRTAARHNQANVGVYADVLGARPHSPRRSRHSSLNGTRPQKREKADMDTPAASLYDRLGGIYNIATVVDDFIDRVMVDERLNANPQVDEAHHRVLPPGFKYLVTEMLAEAAGGPQHYTGRSMPESHRELQITPGEWLAFMEDLNRTLDKFDVPQQERSEVVAIVESTRDDIVVGQSSEPARA